MTTRSNCKPAAFRNLYERLIESGDEVIVTCEGKKIDGNRFRNTEVLTLRDGKICKAEVYFGWDL